MDGPGNETFLGDFSESENETVGRFSSDMDQLLVMVLLYEGLEHSDGRKSVIGG